MKRLIAFAVLACAGAAVAQYPKQGIRLIGQIPLSGFTGSQTSAAGCTGYVSPSGREYGIIGLRSSTAFVEVTSFSAPRIVGQVTMPASTWHENAVTNGFAYLVTEAGGGVRIVDLRNIDSDVVTHVGTYTGNSLGNVHTVQALDNYVYLNGSNRGFVVLDVTNPTAPVEVGRWTTRYVHDATIHKYTSGPYAGKTIAFLCCGGNGLYIIDVTNPAAIVTLGNLSYLPSNAYCHSGTLSSDGRYFLANDEFDERNSLVQKCTTHIINVENLSNPVYIGPFDNAEDIIDHNSRMRDDFLLLAAYRGGLRVYDAANPLALQETGYFDTYPSGAGFTYDGAWGTYIFPSRTTIIADIQRGLFSVDPTEAMRMGAPHTGFTMIRGSAIGGTLASLRTADGNPLVLKGFAMTTLKNRGVVAELSTETSYSPVASLDLTVKGRIQGLTTAELTVEIKNQTNGQWQPLMKVNLSQTDSTFSIPGISSANRVSATGAMQLRLSCYSKIKVQTQTFTTHLDMVKIEARR